MSSEGEKETNDTPKGKKPSLQIYRPPGLRGGVVSSPRAYLGIEKESQDGAPPIKQASSASSEASPIQGVGNSSREVRPTAIEVSSSKPKDLRPQAPKNSKKANVFTSKDVADVAASLNSLGMQNEQCLIDECIAGGMSDGAKLRRLGQCLVQYSIEENRQSSRPVAKLSAALLKCPAGKDFHDGLIASIFHYFECRESLRTDYLKVWTGYLNFVTELYSSVGLEYEGKLVDVIFTTFDYMLNPPVLESLKIEELESLIACLLSVGYELERHCPNQLGALKDLIRDEFINVQEPWARKMLLLLIELGASGWSLPPEANEYYFQ